MQEDDALYGSGISAATAVSTHLHTRLSAFLSPLLFRLDAQVDLRLVRTLLSAVEAILVFRNRSSALLLSELGGYLDTPEHAPAGTKRLSNLLRSKKWQSRLIADYLFEAARNRKAQLEANGEDVLLVFDESVDEKPESRSAEGLCAVRSSKAKRLTHIKPGFYQPPKSPIFVPGIHWLSVLLMGRSGPPTVLSQEWWSTRGERATTGWSVRVAVFLQCVEAFSDSVLHIFDRGMASRSWLEMLTRHRARFVLRWPKRYHLVDHKGKRCAWRITCGKRTMDEQWLRDAHAGTLRKVGIVYAAVHHAEVDVPLWLVVARTRKGREPWYLLTNEPVETVEDAWAVVLAYARRWQIEMAFRYEKSELGLESPRLWTWERRIKLLLIVTLAYAFLLSLLAENLSLLRTWLLRFFCHRNGRRGRETPTPLYRLRSALSRLWSTYPYAPSTGNSG